MPSIRIAYSPSYNRSKGCNPRPKRLKARLTDMLSPTNARNLSAFASRPIASAPATTRTASTPETHAASTFGGDSVTLSSEAEALSANVPVGPNGGGCAPTDWRCWDKVVKA